jgi:hypothetical protein
MMVVIKAFIQQVSQVKVSINFQFSPENGTFVTDSFKKWLKISFFIKKSNLSNSKSEVESNNAEETSRSQKNTLSFHFLYERYESVKQTWPRLGAPASFILFLRLTFILHTVIRINLTNA